MHVWRQSLLVDDFPAQRRQPFPFFFCERCEKVGFVFGANLRELFQCSIAFCGEHKLRMTSIFRASFSFNQSFRREFVDQDHHPAGEHAEFFCQAKLITAGIVGNEAKDAGMRTGEAKRSESSPEIFGRVGAELGKEKRRTGMPFFVRSHRLKLDLKNHLPQG